MCEPTAIAIGSLVLGAAGAVSQHNAQNNAAAANKDEAIRAMREASTDISLQQIENKQSTSLTIQQTDRAARASQALARVSAGEAGVSGVSVEALLGDIDRKRGEATVTAGRNLDMVLAELQREKVSGRTVAASRIASVPKASDAALGVNVGSQFLGFWAGQIGRKP